MLILSDHEIDTERMVSRCAVQEHNVIIAPALVMLLWRVPRDRLMGLSFSSMRDTELKERKLICPPQFTVNHLQNTRQQLDSCARGLGARLDWCLLFPPRADLRCAAEGK